MTPFVFGAAALGAMFGGLALFTGMTARRVERALPPQGGFIEIDGARLHYVEKGQGPAIVMVHGLGGQLGNFSHSLLDRLADSYRVILVDRPGSGYSTRPATASASLRAQADIIAKFIRALGLEKPLLVGHSLGGAISLALALDHPDCVRGLALIAPLTQVQQAVPASFKGLAIESPAARRMVAWTLATPMAILKREQVLDFVFGPDKPPPDFATAGGGLLGLRPGAYYAASTDLVAINIDLPGMVERYPSIDMPVHILFGRGDRVLNWQTHGEAMKTLVPGLDLTVVEGGHMLPVTAPDVTAEWLRKAAGGPS